MEDIRLYEDGDYYQGLELHEDESYFQFQDFSADYLLGEETLYSAKLFCAVSCSESSISQDADEHGCLSDVDFASFLAQLEEDDDARRKSKEGDYEKALINLEPGSGILQKGAEIGRRQPRSGPEGKKALTFELVSGHFCMPIKQAARELNVGVTVLKKRCRELGIPRWPHRKVKSLQTLIDNVQELGKFTEKQDGHLTRSVVESLERKKKLIEERPEVMLDEETKELRQVCFKERFKRKQLMGHGTW
ncbi:unnamed protein product [Urochloa humidicola]